MVEQETPMSTQTMQFEPQSIIIQQSNGLLLNIDATVGVGTGLAYHHVDGAQFGYSLTHIASGYRLPGSVPTKAQAERWLELVAPLADWTLDEEELQQVLPSSTTQYIMKLSEQARSEALL